MRPRGQSIVEYAMLFGIVTAAILGMQVYARRGIQAGVKSFADGMSPYPVSEDPDGERAQLDGMRFESGERSTQVFSSGVILAREASVRTDVNQSQTVDQLTGGGQARTFAETATQTGALAGGASARSEVVADVN